MIRLLRLMLPLCFAVLAPTVQVSASDLIAALPGSMQWGASASYEDGLQHDSRLDRPVTLWRASITLAEAFAAIEQQTGVHIGFWPPGDQNERVRLTTYLNPESPPTLRDLLVQIGWVTDCSFAVQVISIGPPEYYLLSTSIGDGVVERLAAEKQAGLQSEREASLRRCRQTAERLEDYRAALSLSREEAIARYRGRDDMLLLCLVHPAYRATTEFVCSLSSEDLAVLFSAEQICRAWEDWTPWQRELLTASLGFEESWLDKGPLKIWVAGADHGYLQIHAWIETTDEFPGEGGGTFRRTVALREVAMNATETVSLRRALGEKMSDAEAYKLILSIAQEIAKGETTQHQSETAGRLRSHINTTLSPDCQERLATIRLSWHSRYRYPLWEIQEAVARVSGLHIVSDCFVEPEMGYQWMALLDESFREAVREKNSILTEWMTSNRAAVEALWEESKTHPEYERLSSYTAPVSALVWLTVACYSSEKRWILMEVNQADSAGWEWGDNGSFLHFRSVNRDLWRASMLPQEIVDYIDERTRETVESVDAKGESKGWVMPAWTLDDRVTLAGRLTDLQARFGGLQMYEDPTEPGAAARQWMRSGLVGMAADDNLRFFATFSRGQWQQLFEGGVRWGVLTPSQQQTQYGEVIARRVSNEFGVDQGMDDAVLTMRGLRGDPDPARPEVEPDIAVYILEIRLKDKAESLQYFDALPHFSLGEIRRELRKRPPISSVPIEPAGEDAASSNKH